MTKINVKPISKVMSARRSKPVAKTAETVKNADSSKTAFLSKAKKHKTIPLVIGSIIVGMILQDKIAAKRINSLFEYKERAFLYRSDDEYQGVPGVLTKARREEFKKLIEDSKTKGFFDESVDTARKGLIVKEIQQEVMSNIKDGLLKENENNLRTKFSKETQINTKANINKIKNEILEKKQMLLESGVEPEEIEFFENVVKDKTKNVKNPILKIARENAVWQNIIDGISMESIVDQAKEKAYLKGLIDAKKYYDDSIILKNISGKIKSSTNKIKI